MNPPSQKQIRTVALASLLGATIEWYDFFLYGVVAGIVFNKLYFPTDDPFIGTLLPTAPLPSATWPAPSALSSSATSVTRSAARACWC